MLFSMGKQYLQSCFGKRCPFLQGNSNWRKSFFGKNKFYIMSKSIRKIKSASFVGKHMRQNISCVSIFNFYPRSGDGLLISIHDMTEYIFLRVFFYEQIKTENKEKRQIFESDMRFKEKDKIT